MGMSFAAGDRLEEWLGAKLKVKNIEDLKVPFAAVATDLNWGGRVVIDRGPIARAVRASSAIPGVFPPSSHMGKILVDGGVTDNIPIAVAREKGADIVIAVDISENIGNTNIRNVVDVVLQATNIMFALNVEHSKQGADVLVAPKIGDVAMLDFSQKKRCMLAGIDAARRGRATDQEGDRGLAGAEDGRGAGGRRAARVTRATPPRSTRAGPSGAAGRVRIRRAASTASCVPASARTSPTASRSWALGATIPRSPRAMARTVAPVVPRRSSWASVLPTAALPSRSRTGTGSPSPGRSRRTRSSDSSSRPGRPLRAPDASASATTSAPARTCPWRFAALRQNATPRSRSTATERVGPLRPAEERLGEGDHRDAGEEEDADLDRDDQRAPRRGGEVRRPLARLGQGGDGERGAEPARDPDDAGGERRHQRPRRPRR